MPRIVNSQYEQEPSDLDMQLLLREVLETKGSFIE